MNKLASVAGLQPVTFKMASDGVAILQPGDGESDDMILIPLEHFSLFADAVKEVRERVKAMGYR